MLKTLLTLGLVGAIAAPSAAFANCHQRRVAATVFGGLGGGLIGATASAPWGFAAAGLGALVGHTIASANCREYYRSAYYYRREHYRRDYYGRYYYD
jgi:hypothetical protein